MIAIHTTRLYISHVFLSPCSYCLTLTRENTLKVHHTPTEIFKNLQQIVLPKQIRSISMVGGGGGDDLMMVAFETTNQLLSLNMVSSLTLVAT